MTFANRVEPGIEPRTERDDSVRVHENGTQTSLGVAIARNVRNLRQRRGLSLEDLASYAKIDAEKLRDVELARGEPSIGVAWQLAHALGVPFAALTADQAPRGTVVMRHERAEVFSSESHGLTSRALFPFEAMSRVEFFELHLAPEHSEWCKPHTWGTAEILYVAQGAIEVTVGREPSHNLRTGDSIYFPADLPHAYRNTKREPAVLYMLVTYQHYAALEANLAPRTERPVERLAERQSSLPDLA